MRIDEDEPSNGFHMRIDEEDDDSFANETSESESNEASDKDDNEEGEEFESLFEDRDGDNSHDGDYGSISSKFLHM